MSESIQMRCSINNRTNQVLKVDSDRLKWGKFYDSPNFAPVDIPAMSNQKAFRSSGKLGTASGTEGTVVYRMGDDPYAIITIYWDVPWKKNQNNVIRVTSFHQDVSVSVVGYTGQGPVESVTITVVDGR